MNIFARAIVLCLALLCAAICAEAQSGSAASKEPTASVSGRVTLGGKPVTGIPVLLVPYQEFTPQRPPAARTTTDEDGHFKLTGVPAGRYSVTPFAPALVIPIEVNPWEPGKLVTVDDGEEVDGMDFALTRGGVITGRVVDSEGRPLVDQHVSLTQVDERGRRRPPLRLTSYMFRTDDRGVYRLFGLPAGRYILSVGDARDSGVVRIGFGNSYYARTFYPNVTDESKATIIEVTAGSEATGVDITLASSARTFSASGRLIDAETGKPVSNTQYGYSAISGERRTTSWGTTGNRTGSKGEFLIEGLTPGHYVAFGATEESDLYSEPTQFEITNENVAGLEVKMRRGTSLSGVAVIEGTSDPDVLARLTELQLIAPVVSEQITPPRFSPIRIGADGSFHIRGLHPGRLRLLLGGYPTQKGFSLLRVEHEGVEQREEIEIRPGEHLSGVRVVIGYGTGVIRGQVKILGGQLPDNVELIAHARLVGEKTRHTPGAQVDARRRFVIEGLIAGEYELTVRVSPRTFDGTPPRIAAVKQIVKVAQGAEPEAVVTLDLNAREKDREN